MRLHRSLITRAAAPALLLLSSVAGSSYAAILFSDDFDALGGAPVTATATGNAAGYTVNMSTAFNQVVFGYDYGIASLGIPSAPNSTGGTKIGMRLDANSNGAAASLALTPITAGIVGDYSMEFDFWMNSVGPFPAGGTGSTEFLSAGVGYNGTTFQNGASASGVWFTWDNEGGFTGTSATPDYQARIGTTLQAASTPGVYAAGTSTAASGASVDNANPYYTSLFPGVAPPAVQGSTGTPNNGTLAFKWHRAQINRLGNTVSWYIDGNYIASVTDASATAFAAPFIGYWDPANSNGTSLVFGIVDNVVVNSIPEPASMSLIAFGLAALGFARRRVQ